MSWIKLDDRFLDHPKLVRLEKRAPSRGVHLFVGLLSYCKLHLTNGRVPRDMLGKVNGPTARWRVDTLEKLIEVGLVEVDGDDLIVHDYLDWNPSKEEIIGRAGKKSTPPAAPPTTLRSRSDNAAIALRQRGDDGVIASRQHIKRPDPEDLSVVPLTGARARSESESESESILEPPVPPKPVAEQPAQTASTSSAGGGTRRKPPRARTLCPLDLQPDEASANLAWKLGFSDEGRDRVVLEFINWWHGEGRLKADWQATLRNRLIQRAEQLGLKERKPRDAQWVAHQTALRKANEPPRDPVKLPRDLGAKMGSLFG